MPAVSSWMRTSFGARSGHRQRLRVDDFRTAETIDRRRLHRLGNGWVHGRLLPRRAQDRIWTSLTVRPDKRRQIREPHCACVPGAPVGARRLGWPEVGACVPPTGRPPRDRRHLSAALGARPLKIRERRADHRRQSRGLMSRTLVGRNLMERLKIGSAFLLVALAGCGGGGGAADGGLDVRQDLRVDMRIDTRDGDRRPDGHRRADGVRYPRPDLHRPRAERKRDRCRLRRRLPGLSGGHDLHDARRLPDADVRGREVRRRQLHQRHHGFAWRPTSIAAAAVRPASPAKPASPTPTASAMRAWREGARRRPAPTASRTRASPTSTAADRPVRSAPTARHARPRPTAPAAAATSGRCSSCRDLIKNGDEVDVDCGGALCAKCGDGKICRAATDCLNARCEGGVCISCVDRVQNGGEVDVDCGGPTSTPRQVQPTANGAATRRDRVASCAQPLHRPGSARLCTDLRMNADETDIDCGGATCASCANGKRCVATTDCVSRICNANACVAANCTDTVLNGTESDIDCGGADCARCADTKVCRVGTDCASGVCTAGRCVPPTCTDGMKNQGESDVDCGGSTTCPRCADYKTCTAPTDCMTNACTMGYCGTTGCQSFGIGGRATSAARGRCRWRSCPARTSGLTGTRSTVSDDSYTHHDAAVLIHLLRHATDDDPAQLVRRAELQHLQPGHQQLPSSVQHRTR